jgi:hypothetical protein
MSVSISITALSLSHSDISRLSVTLTVCRVVFRCTRIVNFLSHREESGLQWTIIFLPLEFVNHCLTLMFTTV